MNRVLAVGAFLTVLGVLGYALGVATPYPGRAFSVTAFMAGLSLAVIGLSLEAAEGETT